MGSEAGWKQLAQNDRVFGVESPGWCDVHGVECRGLVERRSGSNQGNRIYIFAWEYLSHQRDQSAITSFDNRCGVGFSLTVQLMSV